MTRLWVMAVIPLLGGCLGGQPDGTDAILDKLTKMGAHIQVEEGLAGKPLIVDLYKSKNADQALALLQQLSRIRDIRVLNLAFSDITSDGARRISSFVKLEMLGLAHTEIKDADLAHYSELHHLRLVNLDETLITDVGIRHLESLKDLECLSLCKTKITNEAIDVIAKFANLKELVMHRTNITDAGFDKLKGLNKLEVLALENVKLTNKGMLTIANNLPALRAST